MQAVVALGVFLVLYNNAVALVSTPAWTYVPLNLAVGAALVALARARGLAWSELGLSASGVGPGVRVGLLLTLVIAAGLALAFVVPGAERFLADKRVAGLTVGGMLYTAFVRIPFGTALFEELAFRGVLYGWWSRVGTMTAAAVGSSVVFGLWHIGPALLLLRENGFAGGTLARVAVVAGAVAGTAIGGLLLVWLRVRTQGIVGPLIVHAAANSLATIAAFVWQSR